MFIFKAPTSEASSDFSCLHICEQAVDIKHVAEDPQGPHFGNNCPYVHNPNVPLLFQTPMRIWMINMIQKKGSFNK